MRIKLRPLVLMLTLVTGCSVAPVATNTSGSQPTPTTNVAPVKGIVHGGQQPIVGAQVYLLAVSASGQSTSLLKSTADTSNTSSVNGWYYVLTNASGGFSIGAGDYACGSPSTQQVYVYSVNGNPQVGSGDNSAAGLMAVVGPCTSNNFTGLPATVQVNEVTTVAAAYSLSGFATDATDIAGSSATAVANAASSAANLASLTTGQALATTPGGNGTVPQDEISTLADILAECINSSGPTSSSCTALFSDAKSGGASGTMATDTATAAIYIAHNPGINLSTLVGDIGSSSDPFTDHLSSAPHDWTIAVTYTGGGLNQPNGIAVDGTGNIWTANQGGASISKFSTTGVAAATNGYPNAGLSTPKGIAIDGLGNVWVANSGNNTVSEYNGSTFSSPSGGTLSTPTGIAIDSSNDVWVANNGNNSISEFVSGTGTQYPGGGLDNPLGIALDAFGNVWVADNAGTRISEFSSAGAALSGTGGDTGGGLNGATGVAVDASSDVWVTNQTGNSLSEFGNSGTAISGSGLTGGGLSGPQGIAFDGFGNVWVANGAGNSISEYSPASSAFVTGTGGYEAETPAPLNGPMGIAVDPSGNVWVTNNASGANSITEFVGAATPVTAAPLVDQPFNLEIGTTSLPNGQVGTAYSATLQAGGGTKPYTWAQTGGTTLASLGLTLNTSTGAISGTPTAAVNNASLTFRVTDSSSPTHQQQSVTLSLTITAASGITVTVSPRNSGITINQTLPLTATTNDGSGVNWSASAGSGTTCSGTACGTFSATNTQTGVAVVYTPPVTAGAYIITATSVSETSVTASVQVGVTDLAGMTTYHADNSRDGANTREFALTSSNVQTGTFGFLFSCTVDSPIYTEPLWVPNLTINSAKHNVVFVATTNDTMYAFDADTSPCVTLWSKSMLGSGEAAVPSGPSGHVVGGGGGDIQPTVGVIGTPVIDASTNTIYVVAKSYTASPRAFYQRLHALSLIDGSEKFSGPANITNAVTYPCTVNGCTTPAFSPQQENQRCGLALSGPGGTVYIAWASHEDTTPYFGWVMGYNSGNLSQAPSVFNDTPDGVQGGIWMSGGAPAIDSSGYVYLITGNGTFDANEATAPKDDYGDSFLQLTPSLTVNQAFTPTDQASDESGDLDFGSGGATVLANLSGTGGTPTQVAIGGGKDGYFYVLNTSAMSAYGDSSAYQRVQAPGTDQIFSTGAFWNNTYYLGVQNEVLQSYAMGTNAMLTASHSTAHVFNFPGTTPSISASSASANGILWALDDSNYCTRNGGSNQACKAAVLYAYDAATLTALWNSGTTAGHAMKFSVPTVANGKVYVSTRGTGTANDTTTGALDVFGLLP